MPSRTQAGIPLVTRALIAINVVVFLVETAAGAPLSGCSSTCGTVWHHGLLWGPYITDSHQYWRLLSTGFLHDGLFHILVNMVSLYWVGTVLEPAIGSVNFTAVYLVSLLAGSFGALLFTPGSPSVGASGAIFGIFGALIVVAHRRGIPIWQSGLGFVLVLNLIISVTFRGISIGAHIGGLIAGLIAGWLVLELAERRGRQSLAMLACGVLAAASVVGAIAVAGGPGLAPNGIGFA